MNIVNPDYDTSASQDYAIVVIIDDVTSASPDYATFVNHDNVAFVY